MIRVFLLAVLVFAALTIQARTQETARVKEPFPGGYLLLLDNGQFVWESKDTSGLIPGYAGVLQFQTIISPDSNDVSVFVRLNQGRNQYYLMVFSKEQIQALGKGLKHAGLVE